MQKTVIEFDLVGYSTICDNLEQGLDVNSAAQLNDQIQSFIDEGLKAVGVGRDSAVIKTTGDGAILVFDSASTAHRFAEAVHAATVEYNITRTQPLAKRVFRSGAATGEIAKTDKSGKGFDYAGMTIARAVRLEAKAEPGGILIDETTYDSLSAEQKSRYGRKIQVAGKREERFDAYPCRFNHDGAKDAEFFAKSKKKAKGEKLKPKAGKDHSCSSDFPCDISRIDKYAPDELIGREEELGLLDEAWGKVITGKSGRPHVLTFVALGGEGKTSLVARWVADLANRNWQDCDAAFAWSFYSLGTREQAAASSDTFFKEALVFFGDPAMAASALGAFEKGRRLAQLVGNRRTLLILDGLEPLQYAPASPTPGELKDQGISALLKGLAAAGKGLCIVTTRYSLPDLKTFRQTTALEIELQRLSNKAGVALLKKLGVKSGGEKDFEKLVEDVKGHALTLHLFGAYLREAHSGDIRKRDLVKLEEADAEEQGGHAFRVMDAYARSLISEGKRGQRALAMLRLIGLFDRPTTADCLDALLKAPAIPGLTDGLAEISEAKRNIALTRLESARLLTVNREPSGALRTLDAHPLLREYFAGDLRQKSPKAWKAGHKRLFEHLCATTTDKKPDPTLEDLQPLYQAVGHGCQAGLSQEVCDEVYRDRIQRGREAYSMNKLGALGSDLGAVACFFETPWSRVSPAIMEAAHAWLLNEAAARLRALGRLTEAVEPMRAATEWAAAKEDWAHAAIGASNLSQLELDLGMVNAAVANAAQSVTFADRSGDAFQRMSKCTTHADALHQAGQRDQADALFREAERLQAEDQPDYPLLYSVQGFKYCDLLLSGAEREAWQCLLTPSPLTGKGRGGGADACHNVEKRGGKMFEWRIPSDSLLTIALDHLILGRAALYAFILDPSATHDRQSAADHLDKAMSGLRQAGTTHHIPRGLLSRAWLRAITNSLTGDDSAQTDLDEAMEIAERGPMPLFMADIRLYRARLFFRHSPYPWESPQKDLAEVRKLIEKHGYLRRLPELEDAERCIVS